MSEDFEAADEQRIAWARVNWALDIYGDSPEYRAAWAAWEALVRLTLEP